MAKFLIFGSYTQQGVQGLLKDGGSARRAAVKKLVSSVGGKLEGFYFTYGEDDVVLIADLPDGAAAAAVSLTVSAS
ncbi:MAG: GYD domain-containing protein, partial [Actinobacteria bacterium]